MTLRQYFIFMLFGTTTALIAFLLTIWFINPDTAVVYQKCLFYSALFLSGIGFFSLLTLLIRRQIAREELAITSVKISLRQSLWLNAILLITLLLLRARLFSWISILILIGIFFALEFFLTEKTQKG